VLLAVIGEATTLDEVVALTDVVLAVVDDFFVEVDVFLVNVEVFFVVVKVLVACTGSTVSPAVELFVDDGRTVT